MGLSVSTNGVAKVGASRKRLVGTNQQEAFLAALIEGDSNLEVQARAGSGKSTLAREGINRLREAGHKGTVAYSTFGSQNVKDFQNGLPPGATAKTLHSLGFEMVKASLGNSVQVDNWKVDTITRKYFPSQWGDKLERSAVSRLVGLCKANLVDGEIASELMELAGQHQVDMGNRHLDILAVVPEVLRSCKENTASIDYDDMIWLPVVLGLRNVRPIHVLFIDESQDLNFCQHELAALLCPTGRIVSIGDPYQAIYAFRGADSQSMDTLFDRLAATDRGADSYPLTITWRCPSSHVDLARQLVSDLQAAPNAKRGEIRELSEQAAIANLKPGDMALCRNNSPLVTHCLELIRRGMKAVVRGRDIGKGLLTLVARLKAKSIPELVGNLEAYRVEQYSILSRLNNPDIALMNLNDQCASLLALCNDCLSVDHLKSKIESLFSDDDESNAVVFSTVHRAKGLERNSITILRTDLLPHPACRTQSAQRQEWNLLYVALTRATELLNFSGPIPEPLNIQSRSNSAHGQDTRSAQPFLPSGGFDPLKDTSSLD